MATNGGAITAQTQSFVQVANGARSVSSTGSKLTRVISAEGSLSIAFQLGTSLSDVIKEEMNDELRKKDPTIETITVMIENLTREQASLQVISKSNLFE
ncbi:unnamed protein product [Adineta ricciae]|uniref:Uncharacterized protein n=1 Tax=Adineta ricciae TaxID=249248 RepID=A0A814T2U5_ADIRI|nr:unnamed protein product [Adineta ricciae]